MSGYEFQSRLKEVSSRSELDGWAKVNPKESEKDVGGGRIWLINDFTVPADGSSVKTRRSGRVGEWLTPLL